MRPSILLTGATGYVGGRLLVQFEAEQRAVRCLARRPELLRRRVAPQTEVVAGDLLDADSLRRALTGMSTAYYLIHSMGTAHGFEETDRQAARNFSTAARAEGIHRIIYLGGLGNSLARLSPHLRSRQEVGDILRESGIPVIEFRASIVLGSGSLSFEMIRALVERLPVMITPRWVSILAQPIAINDVLQYLRAALEMPVRGSLIYEIGGPDRVSYGELMREYARQRGLRRLMLRVPVLTPRLSSLWLGLVTPLYARVGRKLIDSIRHPTIVQDDAALRAFAIRPAGVREAIRLALRGEDGKSAAARSSGVPSAGTARIRMDRKDDLFTLEARLFLPHSPERIFPFFADAGNLERITPPWLRFEILTPIPIEMRKGTLIEYRLRLHGISLRWQSEITAWEPPFRFVDKQTRGPYRVWIHEHRFTKRNNGCDMLDFVQYAIPGGWLLDRLLVRRDVRRIFEYRAQRLRELFS
jgi:uncharacterized protein YbjT (DUF2867 family)/ligand-binding SRPBCC domain-containing protein